MCAYSHMWHMSTADCTGDSMQLRALQVKPYVAAASVTAAAQRVSNGNAQLALELVGYDQDLTAAMQYVFGSAFVCKVSMGSLHTCLTGAVQ